jgi:hypothetical protein
VSENNCEKIVKKIVKNTTYCALQLNPSQFLPRPYLWYHPGDPPTAVVGAASTEAEWTAAEQRHARRVREREREVARRARERGDAAPFVAKHF